MIDLLHSVVVLIQFLIVPGKITRCYLLALALNLLHLSCNLLLILPIILKVRSKKLYSMTKINRQFTKTLVIQSTRIYIFCGGIGLASLIGLYGIVAEIFNWGSYTYLFIMFCLIGCSLTTVCECVKLKYDCQIFYSVQTYKFFILVVASILFGIISRQPQIPLWLLSMPWCYFIYRSKQSLPKQALYYLMIFMDVVILATGIIVIACLQINMATNGGNGAAKKYKMCLTVIFFGSLLGLEVVEFMKIYSSYGNTTNTKQQDNIIKFYLWMKKLQQQPPKPHPEQQCSICLQTLLPKEDQANKTAANTNTGNIITVPCGHLFHVECLEQWACMNCSCPMCRRKIVDFDSTNLSVYL